MNRFILKFAILFIIILWVGLPDSITCAPQKEISNDSIQQPTINNKGNVTKNSTDLELNEKPKKPSFKDEEKKIFDFVNSLIRKMLPHMMQGSSMKLSQKCTGAMMQMFSGIRKLKSWTLKLLDSFGKPSAGIFYGTPYSLSNFDECRSISITGKGEAVTEGQEEFLHGKYCRISLELNEAIINKTKDYKLGKVNKTEVGRLKEMMDTLTFIPHMKHPMRNFVGLCLPSVCTEEDITGLLGLAVSIPGVIKVDHCESNEEFKVDIVKRVIIGILFLLLLIIIIGSAVDKLVHMLADGNLNAYLQKKFVSIAIAFSIFSNTKQLLKRVENDVCEKPNLKALRGLVSGAIFCLIIYHSYLPPFDAFYVQASNLKNLEHYLKHGLFSFIVVLPIVMEVLFFSYGFLLTNKIWKSTWKDGNKEIHVIQTIVTHYIRLCLPIMFCIGIILLLPLIGSGPFWDEVFGSTYQNCQKYWWRHLLMISNFYDREDQCLPHFWYVSCLMQLVVVSTIILFIISRCRKLGILLLASVILACHIAVFVLTYNNDFPPTYIIYFMENASNHFWKINTALPLNHFGVFAIGMGLGVLVTKKSCVKLRLITCVIAWILSLGVEIGVCKILMYEYRTSNMTSIGSAIYASVHKSLFALCMSWVVFACTFNYAGFVGSILSWSIFDPLHKLSYFAYLFHLIIIAFHTATAREHFVYSHMELIMRILSYICLSYGFAYIASMVIDYPLKSLRTVLFPSNFRQVNITYFNEKQTVTNKDQNLKHNEKISNGITSENRGDEPKV